MYSQGYTAEYSIGYGNYQLKDIKSIQKSMVGNYGLKITDCFPDNYTHTVTLGYLTGTNNFGIQMSYLTTGGRLHVADSSGSYVTDMYMNGYRLGGFYRSLIDTGLKPCQFYLQIASGVMISSLRIQEKMTIYNESQEVTTRLSGSGTYIEPSLGFSFRLAKICRLSAGVGYEIDIPNYMYYDNQKTDVKANWNGVRFYGGLTFIIPEKTN